MVLFADDMFVLVDFTTAEYNNLATDLNRDVKDYLRSLRQRRRRLSSSDVEWWRITRHLELTCQYVINKLQGSVSWGNRRKRTSSSGNINQTLFNMSMGGAAPPPRRSSESLSRQQLACVHELKDVSEQVLNPKHSRNVKLGNIINLFYRIKQKFNLDRYEREILDYGVETMRGALKRELPVNSPEVVRCLQEVCDLVKQMALRHNTTPARPVGRDVPSLLTLEVTPPVRSRLFSQDLAQTMKMTFDCLMDLYKIADTGNSDSEPTPSTSALSDEDNKEHQANVPEPETNDTFPHATESYDVTHLPVINTFALGTTYDYSRDTKNDEESAKDESDQEVQEIGQCDEPDKSKPPGSPKTNDVSDTYSDGEEHCTKADLERNIAADDKSIDAANSLSNTKEHPETCEENEVLDVNVNSSNQGIDLASSPQQTSDISTLVLDANVTNVQPERSDIGTFESLSENEPKTATGDSPFVRESGNNEPEGKVNQEEHQQCHKEQYLETILEYTYPADPDHVRKDHVAVESNTMEVHNEVKASRQEKNQVAQEVGVNYSIQDDAALDLSLDKEQLDQDATNPEEID